jgi:hypothetical protein
MTPSTDNERSPPTSSRTAKPVPVVGKANMAARPNTRNETRKTGTTTTPTTKDDVHSATDRRRYLEKFLLLCPAGEPISNISMSNCLHQISEMKGIPNMIFNAIRAAAYLIREMEENAIHKVVREAMVSQMNEIAQELKDLVEDTKIKVNDHVKLKISEIILPQHIPPPPSSPL